MAFRFTSADDPSDWMSSQSTRERVSLSSAELDMNLPYNHFVARLWQQLRAQDQLLPAAKVDAIVLQVIMVINAQNTTTTQAIRSYFQESKVKDNQSQEIHWQQASHQVAQVNNLTDKKPRLGAEANLSSLSKCVDV